MGHLLDQQTFHIDARTKIGNTSIMKAASASPAGHPSIVKILLQRGANPYLGNWYGNALHCAAEAGCSTTIRQLIDHGMNPNCSTTIRQSIDHRCNLGDLEDFSRLPIYCTLDNDRSSSFETLVELGADVNFGGFSVFHQAVLDGCSTIVDLILRRHWAEPESETASGFAAMHFAAQRCDMAIISRLLEAGANINTLDSKGKTPLAYVDRDVNVDVAMYMLGHGAVLGMSKDAL
jgi:ankyrin repeat protein